MRDRRFLAVWLCLFCVTGCAGSRSDSVRLVADRAPRGGSALPWLSKTSRQTTRRGADRGSNRQPTHPEQSADEQVEQFLGSLDPETRELARRELNETQPETARLKLLNYLTTVEPDHVRALLQSRQKNPEGVVATDLPTAGSRPGANVEFVPTAAGAGDAQAIEVRNPRVELVAASVSSDAAPAANNGPSPVALTDIEEESTPPAVNPLRQAEPGPEARPFPMEVEAATTAAPPSETSAFSRLKQFDPRRTLSFGREPAAPSPTEPAAFETARGGLSKLAGRMWHTEPVEAEPAPPAAPVTPSTPPRRTDLDATYLQEELQRMISLMEAEAGRVQPGATFAERENYLRRQAELRMLYLMSGQPQLAQQVIPGVDTDTQEFWIHTMWGLSSYFDTESTSDPADRATAALEQLRAAELHLRSAARLEIDNLTFCDKIDGFGVFRPFERNVFRAGQEVLLYAEVRNFKTESGSDAYYRTRLKSTIEILRNGADGELIERKPLEPAEDLSRTPRRDYFHSYKLDLPHDLTPGPHTIRLTLEDELSGKFASATIDFDVR